MLESLDADLQRYGLHLCLGELRTEGGGLVAGGRDALEEVVLDLRPGVAVVGGEMASTSTATHSALRNFLARSEVGSHVLSGYRLLGSGGRLPGMGWLGALGKTWSRGAQCGYHGGAGGREQGCRAWCSRSRLGAANPGQWRPGEAAQ